MNINRTSLATLFSISIIILNKAMAIETPKHTLIKKKMGLKLENMSL